MQETQETWVRPWVGRIPWRREWRPTLVFCYLSILLDRDWRLKYLKTVYVVCIYICMQYIVHIHTHCTHTHKVLSSAGYHFFSISPQYFRSHHQLRSFPQTHKPLLSKSVSFLPLEIGLPQTPRRTTLLLALRLSTLQIYDLENSLLW